METKNNFDINHTFVFTHPDGTVYLPFRSISHVVELNNGALKVMTKYDLSSGFTVNETEAFDFMQEYRGCVGLSLKGRE